eukprot:15453848-Alexandrium_andersonii.AAC.1
MKAIWKARKDHRNQVLDWHVKEIVQNPRRGKYGKNADPPGHPTRRCKPFMQDGSGIPRDIQE